MHSLTAVCRRVISDDKESSSGRDDRGKLKTVKRKVVQLFGMTDKEEENQAADFEDDDALDALEHEEEDRAEAQEQEKNGENDDDLDKEKLLYWEVRPLPRLPYLPCESCQTLSSHLLAHNLLGQSGTHIGCGTQQFIQNVFFQIVCSKRCVLSCRQVGPGWCSSGQQVLWKASF